MADNRDRDRRDPQQEPPVVRQRRPPSGSWPQHTKIWVMAAGAVLILLVILFAGPRPQTRPTAPTPGTPKPTPTSPDTVRNLQQRFEDQARRVPVPQPVTAETEQPTRVTGDMRASSGGSGAGDSVKEERRRRDYESLFASNVVQSTTLDSSSPRQPTRTRSEPGGPGFERSSSPPSSVEELATILRALQPNQPSQNQTATSGSQPPVQSAVAPGPSSPHAAPPRAVQASDGPLYPVAQGHVIDTVLLTRIEGSTAAPVSVLVTNPVYAADHRTVLIPSGAKIFGTSTPVQAFGQSRLAVTFQHLQLPNGQSYSLEAFPALSSLGEAGLQDKTDNHLKSVIGASAAVGVIAGFSQLVTGGYNRSGGGTVVVAGGAADGTSQATSQVMNRYLSRLPTVTIREGHEVRVYATSELQLPAYHVRLPGERSPQFAQRSVP